MDTIAVKTRRFFVDSDGRFWSTIPGLPTAVAELVSDAARATGYRPQMHTLAYAVEKLGLEELS